MAKDWLKKKVRERAGGLCEYCKLPDWLAVIDFQVHVFELDHIIAAYHHGEESLENAAYSCFSCNRHKQSNVGAPNPETGRIIRLFNPRKDRWSQHFEWDGPRIVGKTARGRVTIDSLRMNRGAQIEKREWLVKAEISPGEFGEV